MRLLSTNTKLEKTVGGETRYLIAGLSLAPHIQSGRNVCPWAGECVNNCVLWFAGRTVMQSVRDAMIRRTRWFFDDRPTFVSALLDDLGAHVRAARRVGAVPVVRFNVASDIVWERVAPELLTTFPELLAYDYTKAPVRVRSALPANYHLTHSVHESTTLADVRAAFDAGRNVAAVFNSIYNAQRRRFGALPERVTFTTPDGGSIMADVVCGDTDDLRIPARDGRGRVVALAGKGGARRVADMVAAGFAHVAPDGGAKSVRDFPHLAGHAHIYLAS
jgi:hypothetical protein